jgi:hypothetical protein
MLSPCFGAIGLTSRMYFALCRASSAILTIGPLGRGSGKAVVVGSSAPEPGLQVSHVHHPGAPDVMSPQRA